MSSDITKPISMQVHSDILPHSYAQRESHYIYFRLFEMGFGEQLTEILNRLSDTRQTVLFSATLPKLLVNFARAGLSDPALIRLDVESKLPDTLDLTFLAVRSEDKPAALLSLLQTIPKKAQTIVFLATKHHVEFIHLVSFGLNLDS